MAALLTEKHSTGVLIPSENDCELSVASTLNNEQVIICVVVACVLR